MAAHSAPGRDPPAFGTPGSGAAVRNCTTQQHNTHIRDRREICYCWHPWHGRAVWLHASLVRRGKGVAYCSLEEVQTCRVLEVPLWMLDVAACCKTRVCKPGFASAQSLRELKEVLQSAQPRARARGTPETQHRYLLDWRFAHSCSSFDPLCKGLKDFSRVCIQCGVAENLFLPGCLPQISKNVFEGNRSLAVVPRPFDS
jgi:hypothetical protein